MKKRICALILSAATLLSLAVAPVYATVENTTAVTDACPCGCGKKLEEVTWTPYAGTPENGHFYLAEDLTQETEEKVISGEKMVLDLRGHTVTTTSRTRLFTVNGYLAVLDTVGGGRLSARTPSTTGDYGGVVYVLDNETTGSMFELYSGTITPASTSESARFGGLVAVGSGGTFRMHDGMLLKGSAVGNGGAVYVESSTATLEILGGSIVDCKATASGGSIYGGGTVALKNCTVLGGTSGGNGGNIYMPSGKLTVENSVIANGVAKSTNTYGGGNISAIGGTKITVTDSQIYGGYAVSNGGNLGLGYSTSVLTNTTVTGGVSGKKGGNIAMPHNSSKVTLDGCTVDGDMDNIIGTLVLKGATKIGLRANGLDLTEQNKTTTATGLTSGAEVYVSGNKTLTGSLDYIKPALQTTLTADGTTITAAPAADGETAGYCPHCSAKTAWQPYGTEGATHVYLTADMADFAEVTVESDLTIDLRGYDITATGRAFSITATGSLTVIDSVGAGIITGSGTDAQAGGVFYNAGALKLYGGKYTYAAAEGVTVAGGGVIYNAGTLHINGGIVSGSAFSNTASGARGGAIYSADTAAVTLTVNGGRIIGGSAYSAGTVFIGYNNVVNFNYATFVGGTSASYGGNVLTTGSATNAKGVLNATGCSFIGGKAEGDYGGNLQLVRFKGTFTDCYIAGGSGAKYGGNINIGGTTNFTFTDTVIYGGSATSRGGNIYGSNNDTKMIFTDCAILGGTSSINGGNLYLNNGTASFTGGQVLWGKATSNGGNIYCLSDDSTGLTTKANESGVVTAICGGTADSKGGNLFVGGIMTLIDANIHGGTAPAGNDLYLYHDADIAMTLGSGVVGDIRMNADAELLTENVYGGAVSGITCNASDASFVMDGTYGECGIRVDNGTLYVAVAAVVDGDETVWYASNADAVAACGENAYVKIFTGNDLVLTKDLYVDINGQTVNVSGAYTLYGMDSTGDGYTEPAGKAILTGSAAEEVVYAPNGNTYFCITDGDAVTYHRLGMHITGVNIRPSADGMYYTAKWSCDDTLKARIVAYGVVASTDNMPDGDFANDDANLWTTFTADTFQSGISQNGAVISGIMSQDADVDNDKRGKTPVYAKAYITLTDGTTYISNDNIRYSLYDVMKNLDRLIMEKPVKYRKFNLSARNFYETWKDNGMGSWNLNKIPKPAEDDVIDVLMVGHSFCYYYVEELYNVAKAAGVKMRVCNLYRSSHKLVQYYENWNAGVSYYQFFEVSDDTDGIRVATSNMSLESALSMYEWDYIAMQERTTETISEGAQTHYESTKLYWETLLDYLIEQFPDAQIGWHQPWTNQAGDYAKSSSNTAEKQASGALAVETYAKMICAYYNAPAGTTVIDRIPTGRAWQIMRTEYDYDYMCCRLGYDSNVSGVMHGGDGNHDGDIGGGQYLNACVWFEVITGQSCVGNTYKPNYKTSSTIGDTLLGQLNVEKTDTGYALTDDFIAILQAAAQQAVTEMNTAE